MSFVDCKRLVKAYKIDRHEILAIRGIEFSMEKGESVAIIGPSGAGKSSLLNLLGGLDTPTAGQVHVDGMDLLELKGKKLADYRLKRVGFLWQQIDRNLFHHRSALRNVTLPMMLAGVPFWERSKRAKELLNAVGLGDQMYKRPGQLSGGQQQRVALAVALANRPDLLLADEPTGALDRTSAKQVMELIQELRGRYGLTVLMVTHDMEVAAFADRVLTLRDGALGQDISHPEEVAVKIDGGGRIHLPDAVQSHLADAPRIAFEIRPEGVLMRSEVEQVDDTGALLQDMLPQDAPPEARKRWRIFRRGKKEKSP